MNADVAATTTVGTDGSHGVIRVASVLVHPFHQSSCGTDQDTLPVELTVGVLHLLFERSGHHHLLAAVGEINGSHTADLHTGSYAAPTMNTLVPVSLDERIGAFDGVLAALAVEALPFDSDVVNHLLQLTALILGTDDAAIGNHGIARASSEGWTAHLAGASEAAVRMIGENEL